MAEISATIPDWDRERPAELWDPGRRLLRTLRAYVRCDEHPAWIRDSKRSLVVAEHRFWSIVSGADIPLGCRIGGGLLIPHPNGIVIHPGAVLGPNCLVFQQVTIGVGSRPGLPTIGGHVDIGAGAKILGGVRIGDHARIGANAVVLDDVPAGATVVGIPASVVPKSRRD